MKLEAVAVTIEEDFIAHRVPEDYPKDLYWVFSGCDEEWGNDHRVCPADVKLRKGFRGHCVCGCHREGFTPFHEARRR